MMCSRFSHAEPHAPSAQTSCGYLSAELILFLASEPSAPFLLSRRQNAVVLRGNLSPTASISFLQEFII